MLQSAKPSHNCAMDLICLNLDCHSVKSICCKECLPSFHIEHASQVHLVESVMKSKIKTNKLIQEISENFENQSERIMEFIKNCSQSLKRLQNIANCLPNELSQLKKSELQYTEAFLDTKNTFKQLSIQAKAFQDWSSTFENKYLNQIDPSLGQQSDFQMENQAIEDGYYEFFSNTNQNEKSPKLCKETSQTISVQNDETPATLETPNDQKILNKEKQAFFQVTPTNKPQSSQETTQYSETTPTPNMDSPKNSGFQISDSFDENLHNRPQEIKGLNKITSYSNEDQQVNKLMNLQTKQQEEKTKKTYSKEMKKKIVDEVLADPMYIQKQQISARIYEKYGVYYQTVKRWIVKQNEKEKN